VLFHDLEHARELAEHEHLVARIHHLAQELAERFKLAATAAYALVLRDQGWVIADLLELGDGGQDGLTGGELAGSCVPSESAKELRVEVEAECYLSCIPLHRLGLFGFEPRPVVCYVSNSTDVSSCLYGQSLRIFPDRAAGRFFLNPVKDEVQRLDMKPTL
jgi:hypothetical protein